MSTGDAPTQLRSFLARFSPADQRQIRATRAAMRRRFPTANELVWDNYNFFVIAYSPTERPSDAILSIAARAEKVAICFLQGKKMPDPKKLLVGAGNQVRFLHFESVDELRRRDVDALFRAAAKLARPLPATGRGRLIIRSVSEKQRPRRRAAR
ncbi:MAG: DUF1801 domain-containing protein [Planctomycetota bacterium]